MKEQLKIKSLIDSNKKENIELALMLSKSVNMFYSTLLYYFRLNSKSGGKTAFQTEEKSLKELEKITYLRFVNYEFIDSIIPEEIEVCKNLRSLIYGGCFRKRTNVFEIPKTIKNLKNLKMLTLYYIDIENLSQEELDYLLEITPKDCGIYD